MACPHQTPSLQGSDPTCPPPTFRPPLTSHRTTMVHKQPRTTLLPLPPFKLSRPHLRNSRMDQRRHTMYTTLGTYYLPPHTPSTKDSTSISYTRDRLNTYNPYLRCLPSTPSPLSPIHFRPRPRHKIAANNPCKHYYLHATQQYTKRASNAINFSATTPHNPKQTLRTQLPVSIPILVQEINSTPHSPNLPPWPNKKIITALISVNSPLPIHQTNIKLINLHKCTTQLSDHAAGLLTLCLAAHQLGSQYPQGITVHIHNSSSEKAYSNAHKPTNNSTNPYQLLLQISHQQ